MGAKSAKRSKDMFHAVRHYTESLLSVIRARYNNVSNQCGYGVGMEQVWSGYRVGMEWVWSRYGVGRVGTEQIWSGYEVGMEWVQSKYGAGL